MSKSVELLEKELALLKWEQKDKELNPHKYSDYYEWQHDFIFQKAHIEKYGRYPNRLYLTCANQVGKTQCAMLMGHRYCTDVEFRERQWGDNQPRVGWYVLPTQDHINEFFEDKWVPEILSRDEAKDSGPYAWKVIKKGKDIKGIHFLATGCKLMFITMAARGSSMQGRSIGFIIFDEEPDTSKLGELETRTASFNDPETGLSNAILVFTFTPTSAQEYFKKIFCYQDETFLEKLPDDIKAKYFYDKQSDSFRTCTPQQEKEEIFKKSAEVYKRRVSIFEAQKFLSGRNGRYTEARARQFVKDQPSKKDVMVRAFASFEREDNGGLVYKYFNRNAHTKLFKSFPRDMKTVSGIRTAGIDYGSGSNHPAGCVVTWISPDFKKARVIKMWRGEKGKVTTAEDVIQKYIEISNGMKIDFPFYDHSCADLKVIYNRITGKELLPAVKDKEGYGFVDALLKNNILQMWGYSGEPYLDWISSEFENINHATAKKDRLDELTDCVRYSLAGVAHLFDLKDIQMVTNEELMKAVVEKPIDPLEHGFRSIHEMNLAKKKSDIWVMDDFNEWEDIFNET